MRSWSARRSAASFAAAVAIAVLGVAAGPSPVAAAYATHALLTHAAFFSIETRAGDIVDPQVFVRQDGAAAVTGLQGIAHEAGYRNALMTDDPAAQAYTAQGKPLGFTLGSWFGARGTLVYDPTAAKPQIGMAFAGLVPGGVYSLFENHFDQTPVGFTPLDGSGTKNTFTADAAGGATVTVTAPAALTHANAILLVYHSDGTAHGAERGTVGVTAHHQLIFRPQ